MCLALPVVAVAVLWPIHCGRAGGRQVLKGGLVHPLLVHLVHLWAGMAMPVVLLHPPLPLFFLACLLGPLPLQQRLQLLPLLQPVPSLLPCPHMLLHSLQQPSALAPARWLLFTASLSVARGCSPASRPRQLPLQLTQWMAPLFPTHSCSACELLQLRPSKQTLQQLLQSLLLLRHWALAQVPVQQHVFLRLRLTRCSLHCSKALHKLQQVRMAHAWPLLLPPRAQQQ